MKAALRWLINNLPLMVMALVLASLAWFVALEQADPTVERRYTQPIPVTPPEPPKGMVIVGEFDEYVQVTVRAPRSIWESLKVENFTATVDLTGLGAGVHEVPVQMMLNKEPSRIIEVDPEVVTLELDSKAQRTVPVRVESEGEPALGYISRSPIKDPSEVAVEGPVSYVTQVVEVFASVSIQDADADIETELRLWPHDSEGDTVPHVALTPQMVDVRIPIEPFDYYRSLNVSVVLTGEVASGYYVKDISVEPPAVTVFGNPSVLGELPGYLETKPIDVTESQEDLVVRPGLNVPENVSVVSGQQVEVRVIVEATEGSRTMEIAPEIQGLEPDLTATVSPETVKVILNGPLPVLEALEAEDVRVVLDLFELSLGTHQVEPQVIAPEKVTAQSIIPATLQVEITAMIPTPTGQVPITATATVTATATITSGQ